MAMVCANRPVIRFLARQKRYLTTYPLANEDEYTETPNYPEILDLSYDKMRERRTQSMANEIQAVKTVEEKQIKLNMPRYYGFKCYLLHEDQVPYDNLQFAQHITRTHLIHEDGLPGFYNRFNIDDDISVLKQELQDILLLEHDGYKKSFQVNERELEQKDKENLFSSSISKHLNRILLNKLRNKYPHLVNTQTDFDSRIELAWNVGGMSPPDALKKSRRGQEWLKSRENEPSDRLMQYFGKPNVTLRATLPLPPILPYEEVHNDLDVPYFKYDPRAVGIFKDRRRLTNIPGFWPGDSHQFGLVSYHGRGHMLVRPDRDTQDDKEAIHRQGILASFSWLSAQANFLGFTTYNDITYPLVTQCIITNGKIWSFYVYQLNTMLLHSNNTTLNPKRNICWATKELKLYEDIQDGKLIGLNDDVLKLLLKFYANAPQQRDNVELRPYLSDKEKVIADYEDDDKRRWLEKEYKFIVSNRPRDRLPPEIYAWEKIYKIDHNTRPLDARKRFFELRIDPYKRTYDSRLPEYIPRKHRPDVPRHVGRYAKEYFP